MSPQNQQAEYVSIFSFDTFTLHVFFDITPTVISQDSMVSIGHICTSTSWLPFGYWFFRAGERSYDGFAGDGRLGKSRPTIFCCQNLKRILSGTFWQQSLEKYKKRCNQKTGNFDWDKLRKMKTAAWCDMYKAETLYEVRIRVDMCTFHNYIFLKFLHLPRSCLKCKGWHDLCATNTSHTVQTKQRCCMYEWDRVNGWMNASWHASMSGSMNEELDEQSARKKWIKHDRMD